MNNDHPELLQVGTSSGLKLYFSLNSRQCIQLDDVHGVNNLHHTHTHKAERHCSSTVLRLTTFVSLQHGDVGGLHSGRQRSFGK